MSTDLASELLDSIDLPTASGGRRRGADTTFTYIRELTVQDLQFLATNPPPTTPSQPTSPITIRHTHHQLARLLAQGRDLTEACTITGYSISYVSRIRTEDPAFNELIAYYASQEEDIFVDATKRMHSLGIHALEELQDRLTSAPDEWTRRELMELSDLMLLKPQIASRTAAAGTSLAIQSAGGAGIHVNVNFVRAPTAPATLPAGPIVDLLPEDIK